MNQSKDAVVRHKEQAAGLSGSRLSSVRYVLLDYAQADRAGDSQGPRLVESTAELAEPAWRHETFDCADLAVEFMTESRRVFTCSCDSPGPVEGIWLREVPAQGSAYVEDANIAVWDVSHAGHWDPCIGMKITNVVSHYRRRPGEGYRCSQITLCFVDRLVHLVLREAGAEPSIAPAEPFLVPTADKIAVLFPPQTSPYREDDND